MSYIAKKVLEGQPLDNMLIMDCHSHMGYWHNFHCPSNTAEEMVLSMDLLGIDTAFITAHPSIGPDYRYGNDMVIDATKKYPGRFIAYVTINPNYPDFIKYELERCLEDKGVVGIKIHPAAHGCPVDHKNYRLVYETADDMALPVLIHVWGHNDVAAIGGVAERYHRPVLIMGHSGADIRAMEEALSLMNNYDNVYGDLAISMAYEGNVEWFVKEAGSKKILFGTDMPFLDPRQTLGRVALADIRDDEKEDIMGLNLKRIISHLL